MSLSLNDFATVQGAALCAARVAVSTTVCSSERNVRGVSDPLCHPPNPVPGRNLRGSLTPQMHDAIVRQNRASSVHDEPLHVLVRVLARQAARERFEREVAAERETQPEVTLH